MNMTKRILVILVYAAIVAGLYVWPQTYHYKVNGAVHLIGRGSEPALLAHGSSAAAGLEEEKGVLVRDVVEYGTWPEEEKWIVARTSDGEWLLVRKISTRALVDRRSHDAAPFAAAVSSMTGLKFEDLRWTKPNFWTTSFGVKRIVVFGIATAGLFVLLTLRRPAAPSSQSSPSA